MNSMHFDKASDPSSPALIWDGFGLQSLHSGVGYHAWALHSGLQQLKKIPRILASTPHINSVFDPWLIPIKWPLCRMKPWSLFVAGLGLREVMRREPKRSFLFHGLSNYNLPPCRSNQLRKVLTLHDLIPFMSPRQVSSALRQYLSWQLPRALSEADAIICVSRWTEAALHERFPSTQGRTFVIPNGWTKVGKAPRVESLPHQFRLLTIARHENYKRLSMIPEILRQLPPTAQWSLVTDSQGVKFVKELVPAENRLQLYSGIDEEFLQHLHQRATLYVHPSLWEGFCLPAAASLSYGIPIVYTAGTGLDEVVGAAGIGLDKGAGASEWVQAIHAAHNTTHFHRQAETQLHNSLSWAEVAARTLTLYATLV